MHISKLVQNLGYSPIRAITDAARACENSILLTIGEPDIPPPHDLIEETLEWAQHNPMPYAPSGGGARIRSLVAQYYNEHYGASFSADNVIMTVGASEALSSLFKVILEPGDEVLVPTPYFSAYPQYIEMVYGKAVICETAEADDFIPTPEVLQKYLTLKTKALLFSNPSNPTGSVMSPAQIEAIIKFCIDNNIVVIADEIYGAVNFDGFTSFAKYPELADRLLIVGGFSKSHAMTGWRLGYILAPTAMQKHFVHAHLYSVTCPATISLKMGEIALEKFSDSSALAHLYKERSQYLCMALREIGFKVIQPKGAFYLFISYEHFSQDSSSDFALRVLKDTGVAMVPGNAFGKEGWLRVAVTQDMSILKEAVQRLKAYFHK